jgi:hypothetical protein
MPNPYPKLRQNALSSEESVVAGVARAPRPRGLRRNFGRPGRPWRAFYLAQATPMPPDTSPTRAHSNLSGFWGLVTPAEGCGRAKIAARRALALDDTLSEAHAALLCNVAKRSSWIRHFRRCTGRCHLLCSTKEITRVPLERWKRRYDSPGVFPSSWARSDTFMAELDERKKP